MIKIQEAVKLLGIDSGSRIGDLGQASAILKYFNVTSQGTGKEKCYDPSQVERIAELRAQF